MFDPSLARSFAGSNFRRADTWREERANENLPGLEQALRSLAGHIPPRRARRKAINKFAQLIERDAQAIRTENREHIVAEFKRATVRLKADARDTAALVRLFACVGEGARRALGMWPYPVQFAGARILLTGKLAEMQTGEGKTLVAALAASAMAGSGARVHVISTNDYLAERDCTEMSELFAFLDLQAGFIKGGMEAPARKAEYAKSICYVSGKEVVFDYLKDKLAGHGALPAKVSLLQQLASKTLAGTARDDLALEGQPLIPALHFAIVDEADSVLIDEARTPMILSRDAPGIYEPELLAWAIEQARSLKAGVDFKTNGRDIELLPSALVSYEAPPVGVKGMWQAASWQKMLLRQALCALHLYHLDQHYILVEGKVQIVDESTGRVMADRSWEQGLHQLIEMKEGMELSQSRETLARMTFQRFFRRYFLLSGLTGTAAEAHRELWAVYGLRVHRIPPNRPSRRKRLPDECLANAAEKWRRVADDACAHAQRGQPVLIGTRSVEASEQIAAELAQRGLEHVVLNARQDTEEAQIVSQAGLPGRITVATNMAGRGTDIKLHPDARAAGGLHVILTEFHESPRVDRQLFGRSGRQGDPGTVRAVVALSDVLLQQEVRMLARVMMRYGPLARKARLLRLCVRLAQRRAERRAHRGRLQTLKQDRELSKLIGFAGRFL